MDKKQFVGATQHAPVTSITPLEHKPFIVFNGMAYTVPDGMTTFEFMKELRNA